MRKYNPKRNFIKKGKKGKKEKEEKALFILINLLEKKDYFKVFPFSVFSAKKQSI